MREQRFKGCFRIGVETPSEIPFEITASFLPAFPRVLAPYCIWRLKEETLSGGLALSDESARDCNCSFKKRITEDGPRVNDRGTYGPVTHSPPFSPFLYPPSNLPLRRRKRRWIVLQLRFVRRRRLIDRKERHYLGSVLLHIGSI